MRRRSGEDGGPARPGLERDAPRETGSAQGSLFGPDVPSPAAAPPAPGTRSRPLTVAELNRSVQARIEETHPALWIVGEISNLSMRASGHLYFTLKDSASEIGAAMFAAANRRLRFRPENGREVLALGRPTVWVPRGRYQFVVEEMEPRGRGSLLEAFEALKARLAAEGLFAVDRKRSIPLLPVRIGVATSPDGAALRDILRVLHRRHSGVGVVIAPCRVQGEGAAAEIAAAIDDLGRLGGVVVLIVGRGGGSIEDLWAFNEEAVARAIAACPVPVISAVGHETDVTIADFVADLRAATPSQAAEIVVASRDELARRLRAARARLAAETRLRLERARRDCERLAGHPVLAGFPSRLADLGQILDERGEAMASSLAERLATGRTALRELSLRLSPRHLLEVVGRRRDGALSLERRVLAAIGAILMQRRTRAEALAGLLRSLSPLQILDRGYAICLDSARGTVVRSALEMDPGDPVEIRLSRGALDCRVVTARGPQEEPS